MTGEREHRAPGGMHPDAEAPQPDGRVRWQCPYCTHCLEYAPRDRDAAELAANSHVNRRHGAMKAIVLLPEPFPLL